MSMAAKLPYDHAYAGGYPSIGSQTVPTDADALDYLSRLKTADGAGVEVGVAIAVEEFIAAAKSSGVWNSIRSSCILAGARSLAGALVPLKNEGPELWTAPTPTIDGATGSYDPSTYTVSHSGYAEYASFPRFNFSVAIEQGKQYTVAGRVSGDLTQIYSLYLSGTVVAFNLVTGEFSATVTAGVGVFFQIFLKGQNSSDISATIESLSIREVIAAPTNVANGFVSGDYSRTAGLTGDGTSYLDSGRAGNADPRNDAHAAVYGTTFTQSTNWLGGEGASTKNVALSWYSPYFYHNRNMTNPGNQRTSTSFVSSGFAGVSRSGSTSTSARYGGTTYPNSSASSEPSSDNSFVFAYNDAGVTSDFSDSTLAFYSIGTSLSLEALDTAVTNLLTRLKFALLTGENPAPYDIDTLDYVVRGYENGGTLS
jgi:hypothetical protein